MSWLIDIMRQGMDFFFQLTGNYGVAIIFLTLIIKLITLPLTFSQTKQMKKMQDLQPKIKAIQEKHKNSPEKANKETMALWKENKVNPASGCLPLLLQLPFFIAFFNVINNYVYIGSTQFLWIQDITMPDPYYIMPISGGGHDLSADEINNLLRRFFTEKYGSNDAHGHWCHEPSFCSWF
jgi:YidC/Oxa1 family membrane protein insertase